MRAHFPRSPILSLTVLDAGSLENGVVQPESRVLVVARRPATNPTHPNVVSVPTQRIPADLYADVSRSAEFMETEPGRPISYFRGGAVDNTTVNGHHPLIFSVEALLARKLGVAEDLERNRCNFKAALRARVAGVAVYEHISEEDLYEPVNMLNAVVALTPEAPRPPTATGSYSLIAWTSISSFLEGVGSRNPARISPSLDPIEFCVHGVCLQAASATLKRLLGQLPFPEHDPSEHSDSLFAAPASTYLQSPIEDPETSPSR